MNRRRRLILAFVASSVLALLIGLLSNAAVNSLVLDNPRAVWIALIVTFIVSLPVTLYLFLRGLEPDAPPPPETTGSRPAIALPVRPYLRFFGRDAVRDEIMSVLREPARRPLVAIDGLGGIGKTALAREVVEQCANEGLFDTVVWEPKTSEIGGPNSRPLSWPSLVSAIGRQLGAPDMQALPPAEREARLATLLQARKVLLVLDNLETLGERQDQLAPKLQPMLTRGKCLMTSRQRFKGDVYAVHLKGLDEESGAQLLRYEAAERGIGRVATAESADLRQIVTVTGGSPLAMKLVLGQLQHLPLPTVLQGLQEVKPEGEETEAGDYVTFYKGIFWKSWTLLSETAQRLLVSMAVFAPGVGGTFEAVQAISELSQGVLPGTIEELWRFSFLETGEGGLREPRYYLHPLTHYFVISDIVQPPLPP